MSTNTVHPPELAHLRFAEYQAAALQQFVPLRISSAHPDQFRGRMLATTIHDIRIVEVDASSHTVDRTADLVARGGSDRYKLTLQLSGHGLLVQDHREALLKPGDLAIYDTGRPYSLVFDEDCRILVLMFPRAILEISPESVSDITAVRFAGDSGVGAIVAPLLAKIAHHRTSLTPATATRLTFGALDFVTTMLNSELDQRTEQRDPKAALFRQVCRYIADNLGASELSPATIAAAHYISTRHLHELFHAHSGTVSTFVRSQRLERCRRDLIDPVLADRPIGTIAGRWALHDAAHFSRIFHAAYGLSPTAYRAQHLSQQRAV